VTLDTDDAYRKLVELFESQAEPARLKPALEQLRQAEPNSQRVAVLTALLWERQGQPEQAAQTLEAFIAASPENAVARTNLARLQWKAGQSTRALTTLRFGLLQQPNQERALHLYAALLEEETGFSATLQALELLSQAVGAWQPAWVAAQLASTRQPEQTPPLLLRAARHAPPGRFLPHPDSLMALLHALPPGPRRELASQLRPYCQQPAQTLIDRLLESSRPEPPPAGTPPEVTTVTLLGPSAWRHLSQPQERYQLGLGPICLLKPQSWGVAEIAGRLSRGYALLFLEQLQATSGTSAALILESLPSRGVLAPPTPRTGAELARQAKGRCDLLLSCYLSPAKDNEFILDAEIYNAQGEYQGRDSCREPRPGVTLQKLAHNLGTRWALPQGVPRAPLPRLEPDDALAREAVASLLLCAAGALRPQTLGNPGLLLDTLVEYCLGAETEAAFLTLWAGIEAAARADLPGGTAQKTMLEPLLGDNPALRRWLQ
jgi:hypothetical protein